MNKLRQLIGITHKHGVELAREIRELTARKASLERLNAKRRAELHSGHAMAMFDSVDVATIPRDAEAVAGYVGGMWPTFPRLISQFPKAHRLSIAVNAGEDAACLDVETGDATPQQAPAWARRQKRRGIHRPVVYANLSTMPAVKAELLRAGILLKEVRLWVAHYTGTAHIPAGFDACQWTDRALNRNLDQSLCAGNFF